jgi:hypothetical protein
MVASIVAVIAANSAANAAQVSARVVNNLAKRALLSSSSSFGLIHDCGLVLPSRDRKQRIVPRFNKENPLPQGSRQVMTPVR